MKRHRYFASVIVEDPRVPEGLLRSSDSFSRAEREALWAIGRRFMLDAEAMLFASAQSADAPKDSNTPTEAN